MVCLHSIDRVSSTEVSVQRSIKPTGPDLRQRPSKGKLGCGLGKQQALRSTHVYSQGQHHHAQHSDRQVSQGAV